MNDKTLLSTSVEKLKKIPTFSIPRAPHICIGATEDCWDYCYASRLHFKTDSVINKHTWNYEQSLLPTFPDRLKAELHTASFNGSDRCRIHPGGDFYDQAYLDAWYYAIRKTPDIAFTAYTRSHPLDFKRKPKNLNLFYSVDYSTTIFPEYFDRWAYVIPSEDYTGAMPNAFTCKSKCFKCKACFVESKMDVQFKRH